VPETGLTGSATGPLKNAVVLSRLLFERNYLVFIGAGCRSRTRDLLITNQLLYQLS
jgi:hypothetical protein